jgi:hypothetical protein
MTDSYIAWKRLTHNGKRGRDEMTPEEQAEWDSSRIKTAEPMTPEEQVEAKRLYEEATRRPNRPSVSWHHRDRRFEVEN